VLDGVVIDDLIHQLLHDAPRFFTRPETGSDFLRQTYDGVCEG